MYNHATKAVATLRSLKPSNAREMCLCIVLGTIILTFTLKLQVADARAICRQTLEMVKPIYIRDDLFNKVSSEDLSLMSCLVLTDIAESLMFCEPPTLRYRDIHSQDYVDRYVGISHSLLPLLHDVAELSFQLKMEGGKVEGDSAAPTQFEQVHRALEVKICSWMPEGRVGIGAGKFTSTELAHMLCQAEGLRNAARLVLHRLRYTSGSQDNVAEAISSHILTSLKTTALVTGSIPRCVDFPLIVACLELESKSERAEYLSFLSPISSYSSRFRERLSAIFDAAWEARQDGQSLYWYDLGALIRELPACP
ncbi:Fungal transcriptional regulatory protein [Cordyceps javanica]|nr:Fungal transcriptional regulatory protein [Cordyceps javanica]